MRTKTIRFIVALTAMHISAFIGSGQLYAGSAYIVAQPDGGLSFPADSLGYSIPDYSYAGYMNNDKPLPAFGTEYTAAVTVEGPLGVNANTVNIQAAIDAVEAMQPNAAGYRGAVVLGTGTWEVNATFTIDADGVVIRGAGEDQTTVQWTAGYANQIFRVGGTVDTSYPTTLFSDDGNGRRWNITSDVVKVGDRVFTVEAGHTLAPGDRIIIEHPCTQAWIAAVDGGGVTEDAPWQEGDVPIRYYRYVTAVSGDSVTVDAPVFYSLVRSVSSCVVYEYGVVTTQLVGFEHLTIDADDTGNSLQDNTPVACIQFTRSENCWARNVRTLNFRSAGFYPLESSRITIDNCEALDPHSVITSARRYNFSTRGGQLILFRDCHARKGRHNFVGNGHAMDNGNVFLRCVAEDNYAASESGHQRWYNGALWDNCRFLQTGSPETGSFFDPKMLWIGNHGDNSSSHGWAGVTCVAYKCTVDAPGYAIIAKPPTGMNYEIDCSGDFRSDHFAHGDYPGALDITTSGLLPRSLFESQLAQRHGKAVRSGLAVDTELLDFGFQVTGDDSDLVVVMTNVSGTALSGSLQVSAGAFSIRSGKTYTDLAAGDVHPVTIRYTPVDAGRDTATLSDGNGTLVGLRGIGCALLGSLSFDGNAGTLIGPLADHGTYISSGSRDQGLAVYAVSIPSDGKYVVTASVQAESSNQNSLLVDFDAHPSDPERIWDVEPLTAGFETRNVTARGPAGTFDNPDFDPAVWTLTGGIHFLVVKVREAHLRLRSVAITQAGTEIALPYGTDNENRSDKDLRRKNRIYSLTGRMVQYDNRVSPGRSGVYLLETERDGKKYYKRILIIGMDSCR